ncbi:MAG: GNAT family N-acetyltransferase, partial [Pseudomonadota bacterium]
MFRPRPGHAPPPDLTPLVETKRLILRPVALSDFEDCARIWADEEVARYTGGVRSHGEIWSKLQIMTGHWALMGYGYWAVSRKDDGVYLGEIGQQDARRAPRDLRAA